MKKVCISTYCEWSSYGSVMQALGLKTTLEKLGLESFIVREKSAPVSKTKTPIKLSINPKVMFKNFYTNAIRKQTDIRYENSVSFIREHMDIEYFGSYEAIKNNIPKADYYLAGSDQIFHPYHCSKTFFLDFVPEGKKRLTYSASMGKTEIAPDKEEEFARLTRGLDVISVREQQMVEVLSKYTDKEINVHIDPTFLLSKEEWRQYERPYDIKKPYILVYPIYWDMKLNSQLKKIKKQTGYEIVLLGTGFTKAYGSKKIFDADPGQFLWLIDNAEAVVTSSFHGVAFSLIFNKKLSAVVNPKLPSRIDNLLNVLKVKKQSIDTIIDFELSQYEEANKQIENEKARSVSYLKEILEIDE